MSQSKSFKQMEALGQIKTMPEHVEPEAKEREPDDVIDDPEAFRMAVATAQMDGIPYVIVSEKVMKYLLRGNKGLSITYGDPGIRVYQVGAKEGIEELESLPSEQYHETITQMAKAEKLEKQEKLRARK